MIPGEIQLEMGPFGFVEQALANGVPLEEATSHGAWRMTESGLCAAAGIV